jgi:hypothetical protein
MRRYGLAKMPYARATLYADAIRTLARRRTLMGAYASRDPVRRRAPYVYAPCTLTRRTLTRRTLTRRTLTRRTLTRRTLTRPVR